MQPEITSSGSRGGFARMLPNLTVFLASGAIMVVELSAGSLASRYIGMSLYTWTAIIGVMMAGMASGNWLGGKLADRLQPARALSVLFLVAGGACAMLLPLNRIVGELPLLLSQPWPLRILLHTLGVFLLPGVALGAVTPVAARLAMRDEQGAGRAVGTVFAWGVAGSIIGTAATGYYLLYVFSVSMLTLVSGGVLAALGILFALIGSSGRATQTHAFAHEATSKTKPPRLAILFAAYATVFTSNAAFMTLELAGARIISRQFGSSVYTWTAVIGVFLAGITLGNYIGGRLADRDASRSKVSRVFFAASAATLLSALLSKMMIGLLEDSILLSTMSWPLQILLHTFTAFFLPCVFLGMVSPTVVKRLLASGHLPGGSVGGVYAWGSAGAIVGTLATGYFLLDWLWSLPVVALVALALAIGGGLYAAKPLLPVAWIAVCGLLFAAATWDAPAVRGLTSLVGLRAAAPPGTVYEDETQYSYIAVIEDAENPNLRAMVLDKLTHSQVDLTDPTALKYEYEWIYEAVLDKFYPNKAPVTAMIIGGGGFAFPRYLEVARPGSYVEASEIDPAVTHAAHVAFGMPWDTEIHKYDMDARNRVADLIRMKASGVEVPVFDCILGDSINDYTVPRHLTTVEFVRQLDSLLADDGFYMLNLIDLLDSGLFLSAVLKTLHEVFPVVEVYNTGRPTSVRDTFVVVCSKVERDLTDIPELIKAKYEYPGWAIDQQALLERVAPTVLTDDYAPVELMLRPVVHSRQRDRGRALYDEAYDLAQAGKNEDALALCVKASEYHEVWPDLYTLMALLHEKLEQPEERIEALRKAIPGNPQPAVAWHTLAEVLHGAGKRDEAYDAWGRSASADINYLPARVSLGKAALQDGRPDLALRAWQEASLLDPASVTIHYNLGLAYGGMGRFDEAIAAWRVSVSLDPAHLDSYHNLALAYHLAKKPDEARAAIAKIQELGGTPDPGLLTELGL